MTLSNVTSRVTKHPLDPSDQDTTPPKTSSFFMDFLLTSRHVDHEESTTKEPKTKHHRWPTINDTLNPTSSIGPPDTTSKPPIKYTSDLSTPGKCEQRGECNDIGEKCMDKKNPKMHCNGKYYPDMCPRSKNCQCCILCNQNETCSTIGGECQYTGEGCKRGMYIINKCPGKDHCRCCAPCQQSINCTESNGTCQYTGEECRGTYVEKQCPGPGHCQCCRRCKQYSKKCSSRGGKCQYSGDKCDGGYVKGKCPGGDNCQCCLPCKQNGTCQALGETCQDKNNPNVTCDGKYYTGMCPEDAKNCQCCIACNQNETCSTIGGECQYTGEGCKRGMYIINKCPGKDHCRCCAPCQQSINCTESNGTCQYTGEECRGTYVEKQCPGPGHCQCCRRCQRYSKQCSSRGGKCQYAGDTCNGEYVNGGECPGGDNCQCCLPCKQGGKCQALGEICQEKNNPNVTCNGKYYPDMCSLDAENCQCCIECKQNITCSIFGGVCQYIGEKCRGTYIPYPCSEKRHCQCCAPCQEYSEKCSSVGGKCQYTGDKCDGISVKEFCSGVNCQCCVPKWEPFCHGDVENGVRGCEGKFWCGRYRSHRPHGKHMGVDIICPDGSRVNAPFKGELKGWVRAYKKNNAINDGVMLSNSVFCIKILYIHADRYTGPVDIGQKIGYLLNVQRVYPGITSHIHIEMCDKSKDPTFFLK
ncbi:uncharacterized protein LOC144722591 isoform X2 [Lampetra planeri]